MTGAEDYASFGLRLARRSTTRRAPVSVALELTHRCPFRCRHCSNRLPLDHQRAAEDELRPEELERILGELADLGCLWLLITGGEPLCRPDFLDVYLAAKRRGLLVTLFSNGALVDERIADALARWRPLQVEISLYGHTDETCARVTGVGDARARCLEGVRLLRERGVPVALKTVAVAENRHEVACLRREADSLGLGFRFDGLLSPRIDCSRANLASRLSPDQVVALDCAEPRRLAAIREAVANAPPLPAAGQLYWCGAGLNSCAIDPYGRLFACSQSRAVAWDLRRGSLREGWETVLREERARPATRATRCTRCRMRHLCGTCAAYSRLEAGDPEAPVEFLCEVTHLRALVAGASVPPHGECPYCDGRRSELERRARALAAIETEASDERTTHAA